jgi:NitT/TauT family transport system substrate-binding protein
VVYANNEPIQLRSEGYELNVIRVSDYVQLASNGLITSERTITERPDLVRSMVGAVFHGLRDTIADPEAAYQISADYVEGLSAADRQVQMGVLETSIGFWHSDQLGVSKPEAWQNMQNVLLDMDLLSQPMDVTDAYSNAFVGTP